MAHFRKKMHDQSHTISRLAVHLPNHQTVCFKQSDLDGALSSISFKDSTLMAWFKLNAVDESARCFKYIEIPENFVFERKTGWKRRQRGGSKVIGRMYTVSVTEGERYYLRLLLLHITGATSFEDLRTVHGTTFPSFKDACIEMGLLESDAVWDETLADAVAVGMPKALRELFALICVLGCPLDPRSLWDKYLDHFTEDLSLRHRNHEPGCEECELLALRDVLDVLILHGKNTPDFGLKVRSHKIINQYDLSLKC